MARRFSVTAPGARGRTIAPFGRGPEVALGDRPMRQAPDQVVASILVALALATSGCDKGKQAMVVLSPDAAVSFVSIAVAAIAGPVPSCPAGAAHPLVCCVGVPGDGATCFEHPLSPFQPCPAGAFAFPDSRACCALDGSSACAPTVAPTRDASSDAAPDAGAQPRHRWAAACLAHRVPTRTPRSASRPRPRCAPLPTALSREPTASTAASTPAPTLARPACPTPAFAPANMRAAAPRAAPAAPTAGRRRPPASSTSAASRPPTGTTSCFSQSSLVQPPS